MLKPFLFLCLTLLASSLQAQVEVSASLHATAQTKFILSGVDDHEIVMGRIIVPESSDPQVTPVGYVRIEAPDSHVAFKAKNSEFEPVEVIKSVNDGVYEWLILAEGRVFIDAISVNKTTGELRWDDFIIEIGTTPDEPDDPKEPDPEPDPDDLSVQVKLWASEVGDPETAKEIAAAYAHLARSLENGSLSPSEAWVANTEKTDMAIKSTGTDKDWSGFRKKLADIFNTGIRRNVLVTAEQIQRLFLTVEKGLLDSTKEN